MFLFKKNHFEKILLLSLFSIIVFSRFYNLGFQSLWNDELDSWVNATFYDSFIEVIKGTMFHEPHPPLYWVFLHFWTCLFGDSEVILRIPSAFFGCFSIFIIYYLAKKYFDEKTALIAICFISINSGLLLYHQIARGNSIAIALSLVSFSLFLDIFINYDTKKKSQKKKEILYCIFSLTAMYLHYSALFAIVSHGLFASYLVIKNKKILNKYLYIYSFLSISFIPQVFIAIKQSKVLAHIYQNINFYSIYDILYYISDRAYFYKSFMFIIVFCFFYSLYYLATKKEAYEKKAFIFCSLFPMFFIFLWSFIGNSIFSPRNALCGIVLFYVIISFVLSNILNKLWGNFYIFFSIFLIFIGYQSLVYKKHYYKEQNLPPWREYIKFISNNFNNKDYTIISYSYGWGYYRYYANKFEAPYVDYSLWLDDKVLPTLKEALKQNKNKKILFLSLEKGLTDNLKKHIRQKYELNLLKTYPHIYDYVNPMKIYLITNK